MRVECSCGKVLNVNDKLAGKRIRCPGCSTVLTVNSKPKEAAAEEDEAPAPPPKKRPVAVEEDEVPAPAPKKKRPAADEDEEAPVKTKKKSAPGEGEDDEPAPTKKKRKAADGPSALDKSKFMVKEQTKLLSSKRTYEIADAETGEVLATAAPKVSALAALLGMFMGKDNMSLTVEVRQNSDDELLFSVRRSGLIFKKIQVLDGKGKVVGSYKTKKFSLSGGYHIYDKAGKHYAEVKGKMFKSDYKFVTPDGETEMGSVSKTWAGLAKSLLTGANTFVVQIEPDYADDAKAKMLILGATIAIDVMFKKASGGGGGGGDDGGGGGGDE